MMHTAVATPSRPGTRLPALDWLRGAVMILMTLDHASGEVNAGRLVTDASMLYKAGTVLPVAQFATRWVTHLCAPTFVFLAGAALALSVVRRRAAGESEGALDRFLLTRGLFIAALDPLWMSWVMAPRHILLQVLYAIGGGLVGMVALRRLPDRWLLGLALVTIVGGEAVIGILLGGPRRAPTAAFGLLMTGGRFGTLIVGYPLVPWLAMMVLGWCFGGFLHRAGTARAVRLLAAAGCAALVVFVVVRGFNGYGNMGLRRDDASLVQWLHVSKYPPSLSYTTLELGLMALALAALLGLGVGGGPLLVLGQTALFYYVLHVHLLALGAWALGVQHRAGLGATYGAAGATVLVLYPLCVVYRRFKQAHPDGWARYL